MGEDETTGLLDRLKHLAVFGVSELLALDAGAEFDRLEAVFAHDPLEFGDRGVRVLHRQMRHATEPLRMLCDHLRDAVVGEPGGGKSGGRRQIVKINRWTDRQRRDIDTAAVHPFELRLDIAEGGRQRGPHSAVFEVGNAVAGFDARRELRRVGDDGFGEQLRNDVIVQIDVHAWRYPLSHSTLMPAALITCAHLAVSARTIAAKAAGELPTASAPSLAKIW